MVCFKLTHNVSTAWRRSGKSKRKASILHERSQCCEPLAKLQKKPMLTALAAYEDEAFNFARTPLFCKTWVQATPSVSAVTHEHPPKNITFTFH